MRITFLCSSLERNRDGVGDYTLTLAAELRRLDIGCNLVALNEPSLDSVIESEWELRLPRGMPWEQRIDHLRRRIAAFSPDWISVQMSPYGFDTKGLPVGLPRRLRSVLSPYRVHVMFHELWIGENIGCSWRRRIYGIAQKQVVLSLLRSIRVDVVHTSNPVYQTLLAANGFGAKILSVFGSIPIVGRVGVPWWTKFSKPQVATKFGSCGRTCMWIAVFGSIHPEWYPKSFLEELIRTATDLNLHPILAPIGRTGAAGVGVLENVARAFGDKLSIVNLGEQPAVKVSEFLQGADFAIATSPWALIGKSSTVAAMLDHGLPVVVPRDDWKLRSCPTPAPLPHPLLFQPDSFLSQLRRGLPKATPISRLPGIASRFVTSLAGEGVILKPERIRRMIQC